MVFVWLPDGIKLVIKAIQNDIHHQHLAIYHPSLRAYRDGGRFGPHIRATAVDPDRSYIRVDVALVIYAK
jgi:hypothetical protein